MGFDTVSYIMGKAAGGGGSGGGSGGSGTLPAGYTLLSHVVCDGNAYFYSGLTGGPEFGFIFAGEYNNSSAHNLFGGFSTDGTDASFVGQSINSFNLYTSVNPSTYISIAEKYNSFGQVTMLSNSGKIIYFRNLNNKSEANQQCCNGFFLAIGTFADVVSGAPSLRNSGAYVGKISSLKFFDGNNCIADFVPCKNPQSVVGMYDIVRDKFFSSEGSSQFGAGNVLS